jgi:hypothetical protein
MSADLAGAQAAASAVLRRRAGIDGDDGVGATPLGKENLPPHGRRAPPADLQSPVWEESPAPKTLVMEESRKYTSNPPLRVTCRCVLERLLVITALKPAMEAYSRKVLAAAVNHKARNAAQAAAEPTRPAPAKHGRRAGKLAPLQLCKPDFTNTNSVDV